MPDLPPCNTVRLPRDDGAPTFSEPSANGTLHWAPLHDSGLRERMGSIAAWVTAARPAVMVVEVAMLVRLLGVPVVAVAMPGGRIDAPHDLAYRAAGHSGVIAKCTSGLCAWSCHYRTLSHYPRPCMLAQREWMR